VYFLPTFALEDDWGTHTEPGGRFRLDADVLKDKGAWSFQDNPFIGTKPFQGLLVLMMMFANTDLKDSNNSVYERRTGDLVEQWYVVRDLGASLGDTARITPRKGVPEVFERQPFIRGVRNGHVDFAYGGWYAKLVENRVAIDDVAWAIRLLAQLTDRQWRDAFRAAGYSPEDGERFINALRQRVEQGLNLERRAAAR
jgi:hypothetical protein